MQADADASIVTASDSEATQTEPQFESWIASLCSR